MHAISQSCVLFLWIHALTSVTCKDCTLEEFKTSDIYDPNFETSALESRYEGGSSVRVPCKTGYAGYNKILCIETGWTLAPGNKKCEPKSCGHPGEAQFARFQLVVGDDFVFGSEVVFTCNKGHQMVSRSNRRRCLSNGWDGVVPVCEAQKCPTIYVDDNVQVNGDTEGATFGSLIGFRCKNRDEILWGPDEISCDETGKWSDEAPRCREVKCEAPTTFAHGRVTDNRQVYKKDEVLNFVCDEGYIRADQRPSKCAQFGTQASWIPTPACREIKCELFLSTEGTTYDPPYKNRFSPREKVTVTCGEKYWILNTQTTTAQITCQENGEWAQSPVCHEVTCQAPTEDQHVHGWYVTDIQRKLGGTKYYYCQSDYDKPEGITEAKCTRDGWIPKPLCIGRYCNRRVIENAEINRRDDKRSYRNGERVRYTCLYGTKETFTLTCQQGIWSGIRTCPGAIGCTKPEIQNGFAVEPVDDTLYYSCDQNYKPFSTKSWWAVATCKGTQWSETQCIEKTKCGKVPEISNGALTPLSDSPQRLKIVCSPGYSTINPRVTCENGEWDLTEDSLETICSPTQRECDEPPKVDNAVLRIPHQKKFLSGSTVTYVCRDKYMTGERHTIACTDGEWDKVTITCQKYCEKIQDNAITIDPSSMKEKFANGERLDYRCSTGSKVGIATCASGQWEKSVECEALSGCSTPPYLQDGDHLGSKNQYENGERVKYSCQSYYTMLGGPQKTCSNGNWTGEIRCLKPCTVSQVELDDNNIDFLRQELKKLYCKHEDHITFICKPGFERVGNVAMRQQCVDGKMRLPNCQSRQ